jgi:N-acetylmuramoyl-L-alanine amidase
VLIFSAAGAPEEKQLSIYSNAANYSLPVSEENGYDYVGIFEVLEPLGKVSVKTSGARWTLRYNDVECQFRQGDEVARLQDLDIHLGAAFVLRHGRGLVPVNSLSSLLPRLLGGPVNLNAPTRRLFIGNAGVHFTAQLRNTTPATLIMDFSSRVNPAISTEPGKLTLAFANDALMQPGSPMLTFANKDITAATFSEKNGIAQITIAGTVPLFASFSNNGKTITVQPAPQQNAATAPPRTGQQQPGAGPTAPSMGPVYSHYFAIVDAAHGGDESGATLSDQLMEKDVTLAIARRLRDELEVRGVTSMLLRDADTTMTTDQRAQLANQQHAAIYICIHVSTQGTGVRIYTALMSAGNGNHGPFLDWQTAQAPFLSSSQNAAGVLVSELQKSHIASGQLMAPQRPLNNIATAAVALEVAPPDSKPASVTSPAYQQFVASAVASGIADLWKASRGAQ